jgi:hypothetical protein
VGVHFRELDGDSDDYGILVGLDVGKTILEGSKFLERVK